ncbi:MAG: hypothetical protein QXR45_15775, partial [Candidatus Bathyarchaeia archaeon]
LFPTLYNSRWKSFLRTLRGMSGLYNSHSSGFNGTFGYLRVILSYIITTASSKPYPKGLQPFRLWKLKLSAHEKYTILHAIFTIYAGRGLRVI